MALWMSNIIWALNTVIRIQYVLQDVFTISHIIKGQYGILFGPCIPYWVQYGALFGYSMAYYLGT